MSVQPKPRFTIVAGRPVQIASRETPVEAARRRHGKPFSAELGNAHQHVSGAGYWTSERIAALAAENEARRKRT